MACCILMASLFALPLAAKRWLNGSGNAKHFDALKWRLTKTRQHDS
jgi:hypothetical protein